MIIYNANVKQLVDVPGHEYFSYLGQKTQMEAANQAKIDVSEAKMKVISIKPFVFVVLRCNLLVYQLVVVSNNDMM